MNSIHRSGGRALTETPNNGEALSRRERRRLRDREEILSAASELFALRGYPGTSMQMIADAAELSVGKIYLHFEGKREIFEAAIVHHEDMLCRRMKEDCEGIEDPLGRIRCRLRAAIDYISENIALLRFYRGEAAEDLISRHRGEKKRHFSEMVGLLEEAMDRGEIERCDPELLGAMIEGAVHHMMYIAIKREGNAFEEIPGYIERYLLVPLESGGGSKNPEEAE